MAPQLALLLSFGFILWLFRKDIREPNVEFRGLLIPAAMLFIASSRPVSFWFCWGGSTGGATYGATSADLEGNSAERLILTLLIFAALGVLLRRGVRFGEVITLNKAVFLMYSYFLISTSWSDFTFVSFKRWTKDFGLMLSVLIILTQTDPLASIRAI